MLCKHEQGNSQKLSAGVITEIEKLITSCTSNNYFVLLRKYMHIKPHVFEKLSIY